MAGALLNFAFTIQQRAREYSICPKHFIQWDEKIQRIRIDNSKKLYFIIGYQLIVFSFNYSFLGYLFLYGLYQPDIGKVKNWIACGIVMSMYSFGLLVGIWLFWKSYEIAFLCNQLSVLQPFERKKDVEKSSRIPGKILLSGTRRLLKGNKDYFLGVMSCNLTIAFAVSSLPLAIGYLILFTVFRFQVDIFFLTIKSWGMKSQKDYTPFLEHPIFWVPMIIICYTSFTECTTRMLSLTGMVHFRLLGFISLYLKVIRKVSELSFPKAIHMYRSISLLMTISRICIAQLELSVLSGVYVVIVVTTSIIVLGGFEVLPIPIFCLMVLILIVPSVCAGIALYISSHHNHLTNDLLKKWKRWKPYNHSLSAAVMRRDVTTLKPICFYFGDFRPINKEAKMIYWDSILGRTLDTCLVAA